MQRLLILACSERKLSAPGLLPAIDRYDGPAFRVLRKYLREHDEFLPILILSAKYGLISSDRQIPDYNCRLTRAAARAMNSQVLTAAEAAIKPKTWHAVAICAGKDYLIALDGVCKFFPKHLQVEMIGGGQGPRLTALRRWLNEVDEREPK